MNKGSASQLQVTPITPVVKKLIIANLVVWIVLQVIVEQYFLSGRPLITYFSLIPGSVIERFFIWQPFTYMFLHSLSVTHIVFNMLMLWWFGSELETKWGGRGFLLYYLVCGVGAAIIYLLGVTVYSLLTGSITGLVSPVVGASGAIFGLLVAFGILFGERTILFFFIFPMRVKYFVMIIAGIEIVSLLNSGNNNVANLAHLGGLVTGYFYLLWWTRRKQSVQRNRAKKSKLRLVVDEEDVPGKDSGPKYWN